MSNIKPRMVMRGAGARCTFVLAEPARLRDIIGHDVFALFLKSFHAVDRVITLEQLLVFNERMASRDTVPHSRNLRFIALNLAATLYELSDALRELDFALKRSDLNGGEAWKDIAEMASAWNTRTFKNVRQNLAYHLGDTNFYRTGLQKKLDDGGDFLLLVAEGGKRHDGNSDIAFDVLLAGAQFDDDGLREVIRETRDGHEKLPELLYAAWKELLDTAGVEFVDEGTSLQTE